MELEVSLDMRTGFLNGYCKKTQTQTVSVICRYLSSAHKSAVNEHKRLGCKLVYFMDDDLLDPLAWKGLPWKYRWKLFHSVFRHKKFILNSINELWVSTPYLANKYAHLNPILLAPSALPVEAHTSNEDIIRVCYHGTASHAVEQDWLFPLMRQVLEANKNIHFEMFGDTKLAKRFRNLQRTVVLHPLPWPQYLSYTQGHRVDIGLAPMLPSLFNAARGPTKWFDYARMGAVGLYSDVPAYNAFVRNGIDGVLLPNNPSVWVDAILELANNKAKRLELREAILVRNACTS
jgi:hypothetical protein